MKLMRRFGITLMGQTILNSESLNWAGKITRSQERVGNVNPFEVQSLDRVNRKLVSAPRFRFNMYLNPTPNDRNLEYDQRTNLAPEADRGLTWPP